jgi:N-acyl-D-aspartate/D-glutamate deacylase
MLITFTFLSSPYTPDVTYDLTIRGGTLVDGTGGAPRTADVAVKDGP